MHVDNISTIHWEMKVHFQDDVQLRVLQISWKFQCRSSIHCRILSRTYVDALCVTFFGWVYNDVICICLISQAVLQCFRHLYSDCLLPIPAIRILSNLDNISTVYWKMTLQFQGDVQLWHNTSHWNYNIVRPCTARYCNECWGCIVRNFFG